ncbi:MAG: aspartyl protease family protein [Acidobacteriaceae bacterium]
MLGSLLLAMMTTLVPQSPQIGHVSPLVPAQHFAPVTVPFDYFNRHIFIKVTLNGTPGMVFLLDSGTNSNILSMSTAAAMGLKPVSIQQEKGLGLGSGKVYVAAAKDIDARIGGVQIANLMAVVDLKDLEQRFGHRIDGILGFPLLQHFVVELDFEKHVLTLMPSKRYTYRGPGDTLFLTSRSTATSIPVMLGTVDHMQRQVKVEIDTGSDVTLLLYPHYVHGAHLEGIFLSKEQQQAYGLGGYFLMQYGVLNSLLMGRTEASHLTIFKLQSDRVASRAGFAGVIGTSLLDQFNKVVFDVPRGHVIFELKPASKVSANRPASPMR